MGLIEATEHEGVLLLRVTRPVALKDCPSLAHELMEACERVDERLDPLNAVVLESEGDAFYVEPPRSAEDCDATGEQWALATRAIARVSSPTVAILQADAIGPAWELALACDLRVASRSARLGSPEVRWGRIPAAGGTQRLARIAGPGLTLRLLLGAEVISATTASDLGLVHRVVAPEHLGETAAELLGALRTAAPIALGYAKETVYRSLDLPLEDGLRLEADLAGLLQTTRDRSEGITAFLERRAARFESR